MTYTKVNTLWSLDDVSDCYSFCHEDKLVYNMKTRRPVKLYLDFQGYYIVYLCRKDSSKTSKNVFYHKIVALALIHNGPYELIEHLDDNKLNNDVSNLSFSNKCNNGLRAFKNGKHVRVPSVFEFCLEDGTTYTGTVVEVSKQSGIPEGTLYDHILYPDKIETNRTKYRFQYINEILVGNLRSHRGITK